MRRVSEEPTMMQGDMSASAPLAVARSATRTRSSARPTARPNTTGVLDERCVRSNSNARSSCQGLEREIGLYKAIAKPALAAALSRCSTTDHGFKLSESDKAQKS